MRLFYVLFFVLLVPFAAQNAWGQTKIPAKQVFYTAGSGDVDLQQHLYSLDTRLNQGEITTNNLIANLNFSVISQDFRNAYAYLLGGTQTLYSGYTETEFSVTSVVNGVTSVVVESHYSLNPLTVTYFSPDGSQSNAASVPALSYNQGIYQTNFIRVNTNLYVDILSTLSLAAALGITNNAPGDYGVAYSNLTNTFSRYQKMDTDLAPLPTSLDFSFPNILQPLSTEISIVSNYVGTRIGSASNSLVSYINTRIDNVQVSSVLSTIDQNFLVLSNSFNNLEAYFYGGTAYTNWSFVPYTLTNDVGTILTNFSFVVSTNGAVNYSAVTGASPLALTTYIEDGFNRTSNNFVFANTNTYLTTNLFLILADLLELSDETRSNYVNWVSSYRKMDTSFSELPVDTSFVFPSAFQRLDSEIDVLGDQISADSVDSFLQIGEGTTNINVDYRLGKHQYLNVTSGVTITFLPNQSIDKAENFSLWVNNTDAYTINWATNAIKLADEAAANVKSGNTNSFKLSYYASPFDGLWWEKLDLPRLSNGTAAVVSSVSTSAPPPSSLGDGGNVVARGSWLGAPHMFHYYLTNSTFVPATNMLIDLLLIGGGGGGGSGSALASGTYHGGGGGGGAEQLVFNRISVTSGTTYTVTIGAGGLPNGDGGNTVFSGPGVTNVARGGFAGKSAALGSAGGFSGDGKPGGAGSSNTTFRGGGGGASSFRISNPGNGSVGLSENYSVGTSPADIPDDGGAPSYGFSESFIDINTGNKALHPLYQVPKGGGGGAGYSPSLGVYGFSTRGHAILTRGAAAGYDYYTTGAAPALPTHAGSGGGGGAYDRSAGNGSSGILYIRYAISP